MTMRLAAVCLLPLLALGCQPGPPIRVHVYWGSTINRPASGSTYDWLDEAPQRSGAGRADPQIAAAVRETVDADLAAAGLTKRTGNAAPDLLFVLRMGRGLEPSPRGQEDRATLLIDVFTGTRDRLIYRAWADAAIDSSLPPEERRARVEYAVREIIKPLKPPS